MTDTPTAGHDLDLQVHSRVFGRQILTHGEMAAEAKKVWQVQPNCSAFLMGFVATGDNTFQQSVPRYSTDIAAAWMVVEKMRKHSDPLRQNLHLVAWSYNRTYALFGLDEEHAWSEANGDYATPLAICLAALNACTAATDV